MKEDARVLVVDDEPMVCLALTNWLEEENYFAQAVEDGPQAIKAVRGENWDIVLLDLRMPGMDGLEVLKQVKEIAPQTVVIMMTAYASIPGAVQAMKEGAYDYIVKPLDVDQLTLMLKRIVDHQQLITENILLRKRLTEQYEFEDIIGRSEAMQEVFSMIKAVTDTNATVLITGETGTGKELVARAIHSNSSQRYGPFVATSCGALPETLLESELFGHEEGSFTGATRARRGYFELAHQGTLFLDEIGEMPVDLQAKLLKVIEDRSLRRLGGEREIRVDVVHGHGEEFFSRIPQRTTGRIVDVDEAAVGAVPENGFGGMIDSELGQLQQLFRTFALGDVAGDTVHAYRLTGAVAHDRGVQAQHEYLAVPGPQGNFKVFHCALFQQVPVVHEGMNRHQLDGGDAEPLQVLDRRCRGEARVGAPELGRDVRMIGGEALHVKLVDDDVLDPS